ncbi:MAG: hypothetical protein QME32_08280 [Endomicrobiia bacterium]|nr:hypothetical protein [Endomicrobiia bacterium]
MPDKSPMILSLIFDETAQSTVEYVMIAAIMAIFGLGAVKMFGAALGSSFKRTASWRAGPAGITYGVK